MEDNIAELGEMMKDFRKSLVFLLGGLMIGGLVTGSVLYHRTGSRVVNRIREEMGRKLGLTASGAKPGAAQFGDPRYAYGYDHDLPRSATRKVRSKLSPQWYVRRGLEIERIVTGLQYPLNLAFVNSPGEESDSPWFYVAELNGSVRYITRDRAVRTLATGLLNFTPPKASKSSETGLSGLATIPGSPDLILTRVALDDASGLLYNQIVRLKVSSDGRQLNKIEVIRELHEFTSTSNQIQQALVGPDGMLYVSVGDAENHQLSQDLSKYGGKLLRMTLTGAPCPDNPWYNRDLDEVPSQFVFAAGLRNVFDFDFDAAGRIYGVDNGKNIDRFMNIISGARYGWDGDFESTRLNALWTWGPIQNAAPVGLAILRNAALGSGTLGRCYVACYGRPGELGEGVGKSIMEFRIDPKSGLLSETPNEIIKYHGQKQTTVLGLAEGPDGLYFTDFFGESDGTPETSVASIWRVFPSESTLYLESPADQELASLTPVQRGERIFHSNCTSCHTIQGFGGHEGPNLTFLMDELPRRLSSPGYESQLKKLLASEQEFYVEQRDRLRSVQQAQSLDRVRVWLKHHIELPRFDNPFSKMPSFQQALKSDKIGDLITFLMSLPTGTKP